MFSLKRSMIQDRREADRLNIKLIAMLLTSIRGRSLRNLAQSRSRDAGKEQCTSALRHGLCR